MEPITAGWGVLWAVVRRGEPTAEGLAYETLVLFGRALMRRMEQAMATRMATA